MPPQEGCTLRAGAYTRRKRQAVNHGNRDDVGWLSACRLVRRVQRMDEYRLRAGTPHDRRVALGPARVRLASRHHTKSIRDCTPECFKLGRRYADRDEGVSTPHTIAPLH